MPRALLSVSDKGGVAELGRGLAARGFELVSTGGTARALTDAGLAVTNVSDLTGFPEMMDGRVKTLHPALHGGILARRDRPDDLEALERHGLGLVDVVVVNLYPFVQAASNPSTSFDALVEEIDIGGPSLVRAAAKNFRSVLVVVDPADYPRLLASLDGTPALGFRFDLARKAIAHTAAYDAAITATLASVRLHGENFERGESPRTPEPTVGDGAGLLAARLDLPLEKMRDLRYGENPHQRAAWYRPFGAPLHHGLGDVAILQGKELSYTNLLDLDAAARIVLEFDEPAAVIVKHTNPCGAAIGDSPAQAYELAREADSIAAFGGIVALNRPIDVATAEVIVSTFIEAVIAPAVAEAAREVLARKTNMRVLTADFGRLRSGGLELRSILGAVLVQERDLVAEAHQDWTGASLPEGLRVVTRRPPTVEEWAALRFAWRICAHVKSNAVIFTTLQSRFAAFVDLWDRGLRARDEGRPGPFARGRGDKEPGKKTPEERILYVASFRDPIREIDKLTELYESLADARHELGEDTLPFHKFAQLVKTQVQKMRESGSPEVAFRVALKDGKVNLTARALKGVTE